MAKIELNHIQKVLILTIVFNMTGEFPREKPYTPKLNKYIRQLGLNKKKITKLVLEDVNKLNGDY